MISECCETHTDGRFCPKCGWEARATTPDEIVAIATERIKAALVGTVVNLPGGYVKRVKSHEFVLHADNNHERARWGTRDEITEDMRFFVVNGILPKAQGGRW